MSRTRSDRTLREAADFLLDVGRLQPKFHQRAAELSAGLSQIEQQHKETLRQYTLEWERARRSQEHLRRSLAVAQSALGKAEAELSQAEETILALRRELEKADRSPAVVDKPPPPPSDPEVAALQRQLEQLRRKINSPRFWSGAFAETFAESLASMDAVHQALEVNSEAEVITVFHAWQKEIVGGVELFEEVGFDPDIAEHLRRLLICQWVYLRWQEVTS